MKRGKNRDTVFNDWWWKPNGGADIREKLEGADNGVYEALKIAFVSGWDERQKRDEKLTRKSK